MSVRPLLHCSGGSGTDESDSASQKRGDDEEEVVGPERKKSVDSGDTEGSESTDENENKEVTPYFLRPKKETEPETEPRQPGVTLDIGDPAPSAPQVLDVVVWVRVDSITAIDLEKQSFTGDMWLFLVTAKEYKGGAERKKIVEFFKSFPVEDHKEHWGAIQNQVTAAASTDHPKPHLICKGSDRVGLAWRQGSSKT